MTTSTFAMQSIVGCITLMKNINGTLSIQNQLSVIHTYQNHDAQSAGKHPMQLQNSSLKEWEYTQTDGQVCYLLAPDSEHAAWAAAELSGGTEFLKNVRLCDEW